MKCKFIKKINELLKNYLRIINSKRRRSKT